MRSLTQFHFFRSNYQFSTFILDLMKPIVPTVSLIALFIRLTLLQLFTKEVPKASCVKALDIWMMGCDTFVFMSIIEFILASIFLKRKMKMIDNDSSTDDSQKELLDYQSVSQSTCIHADITDPGTCYRRRRVEINVDSHWSNLINDQ